MAAKADKENEGHIKSALGEWRQGDYALNVGFVYADLPEDGTGPEFDPCLDEDVVGVIVVSQTCDIVQLTPNRQFVTLCPLVEVSEKELKETTSTRTATFARLDTPPKSTVVADLTRMMTVSKKLLVTWARNSGFETDEGRQIFAASLERKHGRFAFPDDFNIALAPLRNRVVGRHNKAGSPIGDIYRSIREIRVRAAPHWGAKSVEVAFIVILHDQDNRKAGRETICTEIDKKVSELQFSGGFHLASPPYVIGTADELLASDVLDSQLLDFLLLSVSQTA